MLKPAQMTILKLATRSGMQQNNLVMQLAMVMAKYEDLSPCTFVINEKSGLTSLNSVAHAHLLALKFLNEQCLLLPKTLQLRLQEDYEKLCRPNRNYHASLRMSHQQGIK